MPITLSTCRRARHLRDMMCSLIPCRTWWKRSFPWRSGGGGGGGSRPTPPLLKWGRSPFRADVRFPDACFRFSFLTSRHVKGTPMRPPPIIPPRTPRGESVVADHDLGRRSLPWRSIGLGVFNGGNYLDRGRREERLMLVVRLSCVARKTDSNTLLLGGRCASTAEGSM